MPIRDQVARHSDYNETRDFIPTPAFATRALYEVVAPELKELAPHTSVLDPAAGRGHMIRVFEEYGHKAVVASDIEPFEGVSQRDFLEELSSFKPDLIVTNPPYKHLNDFVLRALDEAEVGVAMLCRIQCLEGEKRYNALYSKTPPTQIGFFANRIPFKVGKVVRKAPKMFFHIWLWWDKMNPAPRPPVWIPYNIQELLEKDEDYE